MKRFAFLFAAAVLACSSSVHAEEGVVVLQPGGQNPGVIVINGGEGGGGFAVAGAAWGAKNQATTYINYMDKIVALTDDQKKSITAIFDTRDKATADFQKENADKLKDAGKALTDAFKSGDKETIADANADYEKIYAPLHKIMKQSSDDLDAVLTPDQKTKYQDFQATNVIKMMTQGATLTDDQMKELKTAYTAPQLGRDSMSKAIAKVLTADQKIAVKKHSLSMNTKMMYTSLKLTPDQIKQVDAIIDDIAKEDGPMSAETYTELYKKFQAVLTEEQKAKMKGGDDDDDDAPRIKLNPGAPKPLGVKPAAPADQP